MRTARVAVAMTMTLVAVHLLSASALAKGPFTRIEVSGPGLGDSIQITDAESIEFLGMEGLMLYRESIPEPDVMAPSYQIVRFGGDQAFDELRYHPSARGGRGYVYYEGIVDGASEFDRKWFRANVCGETVLLNRIAGGRFSSLSHVDPDGITGLESPALGDDGMRQSAALLAAWNLGMIMGAALWHGRMLFVSQ